MPRCYSHTPGRFNFNFKSQHASGARHMLHFTVIEQPTAHHLLVLAYQLLPAYLAITNANVSVLARGMPHSL